MTGSTSSAGLGAPAADDAATTAAGVQPSDGGSRGRRRSRTLRRVLLGILLLLLCSAAVLAWVGHDALQARSELKAAAAQVTVLQAQVEKGDRAGAKESLASLQDHSSAARASTHGPHWSAVRALPWVGPNVAAVQAVSEVIDGLAVNALPTLMDATELVDPTTLVLDDGRVDVQSLAKAAPSVVAANGEVQAAVQTLDAIDPDALLPAVAAPLSDLRRQVGTVALTTATAARAVQLLPPMLGADGPRQYLMLVQNNSEQRATGWRLHPHRAQGRERQGGGRPRRRSTGREPGQSPHADPAPHGCRAGPVRHRAWASTWPTSPSPPTSRVRVSWQQPSGSSRWESTLTASCRSTRARWPRSWARRVQSTLTSGQVLTSKNAEELLMNTVYLKILDPQKQDEFFAATAGKVFEAMLAGQGKPAPVVDALAQSAREGRVMVWSSHPQEQALLSGTVLSGELAGVDGTSPVIGVYLNDGTAAKIGYYLRTDVVATSTTCHPDGSQSVHVRVSLTNTAPKNAADLPPYISAGSVIPKGQVRMNVLLYAPTGGRVDDVRVSNGAQGGLLADPQRPRRGGAHGPAQARPEPGHRLRRAHRSGARPGPRILRVTPLIFGTNRVFTLHNVQ